MCLECLLWQRYEELLEEDFYFISSVLFCIRLLSRDLQCDLTSFLLHLLIFYNFALDSGNSGINVFS